ncbi:unnamed protein product [Phytophthora fragariaefolia]|uniref:Unnamed protein product n=1 Tax=Phytophthora fragariaefolia TaxID=1490495 RepID=A0A9W6XSC4_9STRA|nr:unnamed protein product [Phytophthora fragariaefolia]
MRRRVTELGIYLPDNSSHLNTATGSNNNAMTTSIDLKYIGIKMFYHCVLFDTNLHCRASEQEDSKTATLVGHVPINLDTDPRPPPMR